eukprot:g3208.t1
MIKINSDRLRRLLDECNTFTCESKPGINREGYSRWDMRLRRHLVDTFSKKYPDLRCRTDDVGNVVVRYEGATPSAPCVMSGSHLDSVPHGGRYDGVLGFCAAIEALLTLMDHGVKPLYAIEVVGFAEEEGRFGGMLGSQAMAGKVKRDWIDKAKDADGVMLHDAMRAHGLNAYDALRGCRRSSDEIVAFLELHIEQGPVLEQKKMAIGIVDSITGTENMICTLKGTANHSGTTPMHMRRDAVQTFCRVGGLLDAIIRECGTKDAVMTIGKVDVKPNFPHSVVGEVSFSLNARDSDESSMHEMVRVFKSRAQAICDADNIRMTVDESFGYLEPVKLSNTLKGVIIDEAERFFGSRGRGSGVRQYQVMQSGAGHDAQQMQTICPSGMIFIPSKNGVSHSPDEHTDWSEILVGSQILCNVIRRVATCGLTTAQSNL